MNVKASILALLLVYALLTLWVDQRWAWAVFQTGIFLLAASHFFAARICFSRASIPLAAAAVWPILQIATDRTVAPAETAIAALDWFTWLTVFCLARSLLSEAGLLKSTLPVLTLFGAAFA